MENLDKKGHGGMCGDGMCGSGCCGGMQMHGCYGGKHHLIKIILKLIIVMLIFCFGFKLGVIVGSIKGAYGDRDGFRHGMMGDKFYSNVPVAPGANTAVPAPTQ